MKQLGVSIIIVGVVTVVLGLAACNNKGGGGDSPVPVPVVTTGLPAGSQIGFYAETKPMQNYFQYNGVAPGPSIFTAQAGWQTLLRDGMGICDREHASGGTSACTAWAAGFNDVTLLISGNNANQPTLVMRSLLPQSGSPYYSYYYSLPSFGQLVAGLFGFSSSNPQGIFDPMSVQTTVYPINDSQGFEVRSYGPAGSVAYNKLIQLRIESGKMEDAQFSFNLLYNGQPAATGTMIRCQTQNCGLK